MTESAQQKPASSVAARGVLPRLRRHRVLSLALIACLAAAVYWGWIASDRYVSEAQIIIQRTDLAGAQSLDVATLLTGSGTASRTDQLLLRQHLLSVEMMNKLDARLNLRAHYSHSESDVLSRMWSKDVPQEWFHRHYLSRVSAEFDDYAGVLVIKAQAYDPKTANAIATLLVEEGERKMNEIARRLAQEQVAFVEKQVAQSSERFQHARSAVLAYQNEKGLVSPESTAQNLAAVVNRLEGQRSELQARRTALLGYLAPQAPAVAELDMQIAAIDKQIAKEESRLTSRRGKALNTTVEEFQRLQMEAQFAQDIYKTALVALEKGQVEATRALKKVTAIQAPTLPEHPLQPERIYNTIVFALVALMLAGVVHLLSAIIRDHKD